ncbi:unnamed protein product [Hymenolepis diminuta]|uniref:RCC1 domain-containing protein n=2 Tax=Hymenolepis diminuta TaxID=6216 RepID=A0A564YF15_HYMDI|nr:unnamed protein product [Hymenolepis diminuta]
MVHIFGRTVNNNEEFYPDSILYSDWHCSVYAKNDLIYAYCDGTSVEIPCQAQTFCSNTQYVFILSTEGVVSAFYKPDKIVHTTGIENILSFSANDDELYCVSMDRFLSVYSLKNFPKIIEPTQPLSVKIKSVASGPGFALFLTPSGHVFSKGIGTRGQLGHGDLEFQSEPTIIEALKPLTVVEIACGYWHSACLTDTGDVYTWGSNEFGQLGCGSINLERSKNINNPLIAMDSCINLSPLPIPVELPDDVSIFAIACGSRHTVCLSENNDLFSFGWNGFGQLGFDMEPQKMPGRYPHLASSDKINRIPLPFTPNSKLSLICGSWCTIIREIQ